jgi:hypothetical protein
MSQSLRASPELSKLAKNLGIQNRVDPVDGILGFCDQRVSEMMQDFPDCETPAAMLDCVAAKAGIFFEEVYSDDDVCRLIDKYVVMGEMGFVILDEELSDETYGITIRRQNREGWEPLFVSVIDCREDKAARAYYTKWHEIAHVLTLTDDAQISFKRTHASTNTGDPEERMMDLIAARLGFHPALTAKFMHAYEEISFEVVDELRAQLCPSASRQAALINFSRFWPTPCILIRAAMGLKKQQEAQLEQQYFFFHEPPKEALRAVSVTGNDAAREMKFTIYPNWRVPERSVIFQVYSENIGYAEALENLDWWESSGGKHLSSCRVKVQARRSGNTVDALITPLDQSENLMI